MRDSVSVMASTSLLLLSSLAIQGALCCLNDYHCQSLYFEWYPRNASIDISQEDATYFFFHAEGVNAYDCPGLELHWEILRADGEAELYTVVNETYRYGRDEWYPESGLGLYTYCGYYYYSNNSYCYTYLDISPTDLRYDGAQITAVLDLPGCFTSSNFSDTVTLNIQGAPGPPTEVQVEQVSVDSVTVSWSPPFTLEVAPVLHYTVYITSSTGYNEAVNTTQTEVSLQRSCSVTTYQVSLSAWNEIGEGKTSSPVTITGSSYQAVVALSVVLGGTLVGWVVTILVCVITICVMKRRIRDSKQPATSEGNTDTTLQAPVNLYSQIYEEIDQKPNAEDIELSTNTAYEMVKK